MPDVLVVAVDGVRVELRPQLHFFTFLSIPAEKSSGISGAGGLETASTSTQLGGGSAVTTGVAGTVVFGMRRSSSSVRKLGLGRPSTLIKPYALWNGGLVCTLSDTLWISSKMSEKVQ